MGILPGPQVASVVLDCSRRLNCLIERMFECVEQSNKRSNQQKWRNLPQTRRKTAARLDTSRGFVTKYEANSRRLCLPKTEPLIVKHYTSQIPAPCVAVLAVFLCASRTSQPT
jgi:hypothetical protein